jgi:hypothetical protein
MAQGIGAKELHFFVPYLLLIYNIVDDTEVDMFFANLTQDNLLHSKIMIK